LTSGWVWVNFYLMKPMRYFIINFGCQMNVRDAERMEGILRERGLSCAERIEDADLILVNTCTVREKPERKALSQLGRLCEMKKNRRELLIGICGCVSQQYQDSLLARFPELDFVLGTSQVAHLGEVLDMVISGKRVCRTEWITAEESEILFRTSLKEPVNSVSKFVTIMEGCDNYCAYCVVPYVRGREFSRKPEDIIAEITSLAEQGVKEVVLLGQNVNSYGLKNGFGLDFPGLLKQLAKIDGIERIRFTTNHPKDLSERLIEVMAQEDKICEQIHLPLQAGSDKILQLMGRFYTKSHYLDLIRKLRNAMPEIGISTDLIVGFPGETEDDFIQTLEMVQEIQFDEAFTFRYCHRPMTRSASLPDQVPEPLKLERLYRLNAIVSHITERKNQEQVGKIKEILIEGESKTDPEKLTGRTREGRLVHIPGKNARDLKGKLVLVKIEEGLKHSLLGELLEETNWQGEKQCLLR